jgi:mRNA interferase MazF
MRERGEVWVAHLGPKGGKTPGRTRPVLLVQARALLGAGHPSTIVIPFTTNLVEDAEPLRLRIPAQGELRADSDLLVDQLRAIDDRLLVRGPLTTLPPELMERVGRAMCEVLDIEVESSPAARGATTSR